MNNLNSLWQPLVLREGRKERVNVMKKKCAKSAKAPRKEEEEEEKKRRRRKKKKEEERRKKKKEEKKKEEGRRKKEEGRRKKEEGRRKKEEEEEEEEVGDALFRKSMKKLKNFWGARVYENKSSEAAPAHESIYEQFHAGNAIIKGQVVIQNNDF